MTRAIFFKEKVVAKHSTDFSFVRHTLILTWQAMDGLVATTTTVVLCLIVGVDKATWRSFRKVKLERFDHALIVSGISHSQLFSPWVICCTWCSKSACAIFRNRKYLNNSRFEIWHRMASCTSGSREAVSIVALKIHHLEWRYWAIWEIQLICNSTSQAVELRFA